MVLATIRMIIPPKKRDGALKILRSTAEQCKVHPGCLGCHIYDDVQEDNVLMFEEMERRHIVSVLERTGWRVAGKGGAAEVLGLTRSTLYSKMKRLSVHRPSF